MTDRIIRKFRRSRARRSGAWPIPALLFASLLAISAGFGAGGEAKATDLVDVIFVLDNSGSMREHDPEYLTRRAVRHFASALARDRSLDGRVGVVLFDQEARVVFELTDINPTASQPESQIEANLEDSMLAQALHGLDFSGQRTNTPAGIERALYEFRENGREGARQAIILLTDGRIDTGDRRADLEAGRWLREDLAAESESSGIRIFGIAFTESADYQLMQALARRTDADYYRAIEASGLATVIDDVLRQIGEVDDPLTQALAHAIPLSAGSPTAERPPVSAPPRADGADGGVGVLALVPLALLLTFGALFWQRRIAKIAGLAPAAQLLDVGGHLGESGAAIQLSRGVTRIGRDGHNSLVIDDETISSEHAVIGLAEGQYYLEDRRSTNGTRLGEKRLEPGQRVQLKGGDHIRLADVDLMFVLAGYVPGGATVFLTTPTSPPPGWKQTDLAAQKKPDQDPVSPGDPSFRPSAAQRALAFSGSEPKQAADVVDLDQKLREDNPVDAANQVKPLTNPAIRRGPLSLLPAPETPEEEEAAGTESMESATRSEDLEAFRRCLDYHLEMIGQISPDFASFVEAGFDEELRNALTLTVLELSTKAKESRHIEHKEYTFNRTRFSICGVPGEMETAREYFGESFGGFSRMLTEQLQSNAFRKDRCEILVVLSAGVGESPWVSMSIVPDDGQDPRIDLLSYELLTTEERQEIERHDQDEASQSGIA